MAIINGLEQVIRKYQIDYTITRKGNKSIVDGKPVYILQTFTTQMFVNTAKKEDAEFMIDVGLTKTNLLKIRLLKSATEIKIGDEFIFAGTKYRVLKEKEYQGNSLNFRAFYAVVVDE